MTRYREHWNPAHPAVRDWIDRHPDACDSLAYRRAMVRHRRGINPPRNRDGLRAAAGLVCLILAGGAVEQAPGLAVGIAAVAVACLWPFLTDRGQA
jgi:hypothetical protein